MQVHQRLLSDAEKVDDARRKENRPSRIFDAALRSAGRIAMHLVVALTAVSIWAAPAEAQSVLVLNSSGRSIHRPVVASVGGLTVEVLGVPRTAAARAKYELRYRYLSPPDQPFLLAQDDLKAQPGEPKVSDRLIFNVPAGGRSATFLILNLWHQTNEVVTGPGAVTEAQIAEAEAAILNIQKEIAALPESKSLADLRREQAELESAEPTEDERQLRRNQEEQNALKAERQKEIDTLAKIPAERPAEIVREVQAELRLIEQRLREIAGKLAVRSEQIDKIRASIDALEAKIGMGQLSQRLISARENLKMLANRRNNESFPKYEVLAINGLVVGKKHKAIQYSIEESVSDPGERPFALRRMGDPPILYNGDHVWLTIANRRPAVQTAPFALAVEVTTGQPINSTPIRPSFEAKVDLQSGTDRVEISGADQAFTDYLLPLPRPVAGDDLLKITISTYLPHLTTDKSTTTTTDGETTAVAEVVRESSDVKLIEKDPFPQVRPLYVYNLATGVFASRLVNRSFVKVLTTADNPATEDVDESRYRVDQRDLGHRVIPVLGFSWSYIPTDTQRAIGWRDLFPRPTVAFSLSSPRDDLFAGATIEILRNTHLFVGKHFGKTTRLVPRSDVNEDTVSTAPLTETTRTSDWAWGLTFNINFIRDLFK